LAAEKAALVRLLREAPVFRGLTWDIAAEVADRLQRHAHRAGEVVTREGDPAVRARRVAARPAAACAVRQHVLACRRRGLGDHGAFSSVFAAIGLAMKDAETGQVAGFLPLFPLVFAFVDHDN
jgi:hypothetical protein